MICRKQLNHFLTPTYNSLFNCLTDTGTLKRVRVTVMVFNATFNNISVTLWWSVLLVVETRVPGKSHRPVTSD